MVLDQVANPLRIALAVAAAGDRVRPARRVDTDGRPNDSSGNLYRCDLGNGDAFFAAPEKSRLHLNHVQRIHHNANRKEEVSFGPAAGNKNLTIGSRVSHMGWQLVLLERISPG